MTTMNISLPDALKRLVDQQVDERGYRTSSEYVQELMRRDQQRQHIRTLVPDGATPGLTHAVTREYFESLRGRVRNAAK